MKALGFKILNYISALYQMEVITTDERNEFARLIQLAMDQDTMYHSVHVKLRALLDKVAPNTPAEKIVQECLEHIQSTSSQVVG